MDQKHVYGFAKWQVKEGNLVTVLAMLAEVAEKTSREDGNLFYEVHQGNDDSNTLILFEGYTDDSAIKSHRNAEYFQELIVGKIIPLLDSREVTLVSQLDFNIDNSEQGTSHLTTTLSK